MVLWHLVVWERPRSERVLSLWPDTSLFRMVVPPVVLCGDFGAWMDLSQYLTTGCNWHWWILVDELFAEDVFIALEHLIGCFPRVRLAPVWGLQHLRYPPLRTQLSRCLAFEFRVQGATARVQRHIGSDFRLLQIFLLLKLCEHSFLFSDSLTDLVLYLLKKTLNFWYLLLLHVETIWFLNLPLFASQMLHFLLEYPFYLTLLLQQRQLLLDQLLSLLLQLLYGWLGVPDLTLLVIPQSEQDFLFLLLL